QQKAQEPSKEQVQALIAQAMQQQSPSPATGASAMLVQPAGPTVDLTEAEAVARATDRNLTLISERITPQTWDYTIAATRAAYGFNLTSSLANNSANTPTSNVFEGGVR